MNPLPVLLRRAAAACAPLWLPLACWGAGPSPSDVEDLELLLNQPVYAASKFAQDAAAAPAAVTVLTAGDIRSNGWRTLAEVLNGVRGVYLRDDRTYSYLGVRGFGRPGDFSSRLLVLIDGMRLNDNIYGSAAVGREFPLDIALIERVEFVPGPGSALYGSNAVLGVVNIVTKSVAALSAGTALVEIGSDGSRQLGLTKGLEFGAARLVLAAKAETRPGRERYFAEFDAPATNFGVAADADRETDRKLYAKWTRGDLTVAALVSERRKQIPIASFDTVFASRQTVAADSYGFVDAQYQHTLNSVSQVFLRGTLGQYGFTGSYDYGPNDGLLQLRHRGRWAGVEGRWQFDGWQQQRLVLGLEAQRNLQQRQRAALDGPNGGVLADIDTTSQRWGLFVNDEITLRPGLRAVLGARLDRQLDGRQRATPRLALLWDAAPGLVVKWLDGRAYREPNVSESQYSDNTAQANPLLRSETLRATELAVEWRALPHLRLAGSVYRYTVADLIEQQVDAGSGLLVFNNVGAVKAQGLELEADYVDASGWRLRASWAGQRARDGSGNGSAQIGNSPDSLTKLNLSLPLPALQSRLGLEWQRVGQRLTVARASLPPHSVANLSLQVAPPSSRLSLSASIYNLFDKSFADPGGPELRQDTLLQDGRQWRLQLALQF